MKKSVKSVNPCQSVIQTSYEIIKAHGGTISVDSTENEGLNGEQTGTEFILQIPIS